MFESECSVPGMWHWNAYLDRLLVSAFVICSHDTERTTNECCRPCKSHRCIISISPRFREGQPGLNSFHLNCSIRPLKEKKVPRWNAVICLMSGKPTLLFPENLETSMLICVTSMSWHSSCQRTPSVALRHQKFKSSQNVQTRASHGRELKSYTCTHQLKLICVHSGKCFAAADCLQLDKDRYCKGVELLRENFQCSTFFPRKAHGYCNFARWTLIYSIVSFSTLGVKWVSATFDWRLWLRQRNKNGQKRTWHHALRSVQQSSTSPVFIDFRMLRFCFDSHLRFDQNACRSLKPIQ